MHEAVEDAGNTPTSGPLEPKPVFDGDWQSASGVEKGRHSQRVREWRERTGQSVTGKAAKAQSQAGTGLQPLDRDASDLATLQAIADGADLSSDRIRAIEAKQRILNRIEAEQAEAEHGELRALRAALDLLPEPERVAALGTLLRASPQVGDPSAA